VPENLRVYARYARKRLDDDGYTETETSLNEWNPRPELRGTAEHAAIIAACLSIMQEEPIDTGMFYDARMGVSLYGGMFNPMSQTPFPSYYSFMAFNSLYKLKNQCCAVYDSPLYVTSATDGKYGAVMISNPTDEDVSIDADIPGRILEVKVIDSFRCLSPIGDKLPKTVKKGSVLLANVEI
jgi:hypothetical protein